MLTTMGNGELVMVVMGRLDGEITGEHLAVECWRAYPRRFGLRGYDLHYPDPSKVYVPLMGAKGLIHQGLIEKVGPKRYRLTAHGQQWIVANVSRVEKIVEPPPVLKMNGERRVKEVVLQEDFARSLRRLTESKAYRDRDQLPTLTFADACVFWDLPATFPPHQAQTATEDVDTLLTYAKRMLRTNFEAVLPGGRVLMRKDINDLEAVQDALLNRFESHLKLLQRRKA
jgi:hypothetical protein